MTDQHDAAARAIVEERICCTAAQHCQVEALAIRIATALRAAYEAGQREMRARATALLGTMAERPYDNEPEFSAIMDAEATVRALPLKESDHG